MRRCFWRWGAAVFFVVVLRFGTIATATAAEAPTNDTATAAAPSDIDNSPTNGLGAWIWAEKTFDRQTCRLWKSFEIPASATVTKARLLMTADNEFTLFLDGRELGHGAEWRELFNFDLTPLLSGGKHTLAVEGFNLKAAAGMILGLRIELSDGRVIEIKSDQSWSIVPEGTMGWQKQTDALAAWPSATVVAELGTSPWWSTPTDVTEPSGNAGTALDTLEAYDNPTNALGAWIWAEKTFDRQTCRLWRSFEIPAFAAVTKSRLLMTADNEFTLFLDGRELGHGAEWRELHDFNLTPLLSPGKHVLAVVAFNSTSYAGMVLGLRIELSDGRLIEIKSDQAWRIVPGEIRHWETRTEAPDAWPPATVVGTFGARPWEGMPVNINKMPTLEPIRVFFWQTGWFQIALLSMCGLVILFSFRLMAQLALHKKERWLLQQERERIARDIHDDLGSRMTQLVLHGEVAASELAATSPTRSQLDRICEESREMLSRMDEILWAVNPQRDTLRDFSSYVCGYVQEFLKPTAIQSLFEVDPEMSTAALDLPLRRSLLMAIKETLNNAVKHSEATEIRLEIHVRGEKLVVVVQDNGKGFDPAASKTRGNGLANLAQRMSNFGGTCLVTSQPGKGCRIAFDIPMPHSRRHRWSWLWNSGRFNEAKKPLVADTAPSHNPTQC